MCTMVDYNRIQTSMWGADERFQLCGLRRRAAELPDVTDRVPFGLTRTTIITASKTTRLGSHAVLYDPVTQMSVTNDGQLAIMANRTDVYCWEQTTEDMQKYRDKVVDDTKDD